MALIDLWKKDRGQLADKNIQQVITFAGDGRLADNSIASSEVRGISAISLQNLSQNIRISVFGTPSLIQVLHFKTSNEIGRD